MNRFAKLALSAATAISLAVAPMQAAAGPDEEDLARALAGLAVLGIVAKVASDRDKKRDRSSVTRDATTRFDTIEGHRRSASDTFDRFDRYDRNGRVIRGDIRRPNDRWDDHRGYKRAELPAQCLLTVDTGRKLHAAYAERCLERNFKHARKLPQECRWEVQTDRGWRSVYGARCLRRDGWQVAGR